MPDHFGWHRILQVLMVHIKASKHACVTDLFVETAGSGVHDELVVKINESLSSTVGKIQLNPAHDWLQHRTCIAAHVIAV